MTIPLAIAACLFATMALGFAKAFWDTRRVSLLLGAIVCGVASLASANLEAWWPLVVGFLAASLVGWLAWI
jgi:hypothetical protein